MDDINAIRKQLSAPGWSKIVSNEEKDKGGNWELQEVWLFNPGGKLSGIFIINAEPGELQVVNIVGPIDFSKLGALADFWESRITSATASGSQQPQQVGRMRMMRRLVAFSLLAWATALNAQEPAPILEASFEVASVKRNIDGGPTTFNPQATGQFTVINFPFATLITAAYQLQPYQLQGAPSWTGDERYDINARLDPRIASRLQPDGHPPTWALALRNLLTERARLAFHRETREMPIYALVMARADRKPGPNLQPAKADCDALRTESEAAARAGRPSPYPPRTETWTPCGLRTAPAGSCRADTGSPSSCAS
jgi:hypothetical protein